MISLKDYAKDNGITYEAVRQQVARYKKELEPHIHKQGRKQFLDDNAVAFLDQHRAQSPVSVYNSDAIKALEQLREQNNVLALKIAELADWKAEKSLEIARAEQTLIALETSQQDLIEAKSELAQKAVEALRLSQEAEELRGKVEASEAAQEALRAENEALKAMTIWQWIRWRRKGE